MDLRNNVRQLRPAALLAAASGRIRRGARTASYRPPSGLSVPIVTVLDRADRVIVDEQRAIVNYAIQAGAGADVIFAAGTTGEWNRIDPAQSRIVTEIAIDECRRARRMGLAIEAWAGITAHTRAATLANLKHALEAGADAAVVAPLSIGDIDDAPEFIERDLSEMFERSGRSLPIFLYDNADIAAKDKAPHLHTRDVKRMSQLPYVFGIKVTAGKAVLGNYTRAASHFKPRSGFAIYPGEAYLIFDLFRPPTGVTGRARNYWNRYLTRHSLPDGVVAGAANVMPREWRRSWEVCAEHDITLIDRYQSVLEEFPAICEFKRGGKPVKLTLACLKAALVDLGVCRSDQVASGTAALEAAEKREFLRRFRAMRRRAAATLEPEWLSGLTGPVERPRARADA